MTGGEGSGWPNLVRLRGGCVSTASEAVVTGRGCRLLMLWRRGYSAVDSRNEMGEASSVVIRIPARAAKSAHPQRTVGLARVASPRLVATGGVICRMQCRSQFLAALDSGGWYRAPCLFGCLSATATAAVLRCCNAAPGVGDVRLKWNVDARMRRADCPPKVARFPPQRGESRAPWRAQTHQGLTPS